MTDIETAGRERRAASEGPEDAAPDVERGIVIDLRPVEVLALDPGASFADAREHGLLVPQDDPDVS